jgi:hypothetical protein
MTSLEASLPAGRRLRLIDATLSAWALAWIVVGAVVASEVHGLAELSDTVGDVGAAVEASGVALSTLGGVPVIGDAFGGALEAASERIQEAGRSAQESGASSRDSVDVLSVLLGLSVALIPSLPLLAGYLPARMSRAREVRALAEARRRSGDDPLFQEFLARRAAQSLPYRRLRDIAPEPWRELAEGRFGRLADAELERLGLSPQRGS